MSKIGAHVSAHPRHTIETFCRAKPAVMLGLNDSGVLTEAKNWSNGHTWTFYRTTNVYGERPSDMHDPPGTYDQMAHYWYLDASPSLKEKYSQNPADAYLITNEAGGGESEDPNEIRQNYKNLVAYERAVMKLANTDGYKVAVLALGGGSPGDFQVWVDICVPFIKEAYDAGNFYARHAYEGNWDRVYKEAQYLLDHGLGYGGMVITEWGFDGGYGQIHDAQKIKDEDTALMAYPNVMGFCLWEYGKTEFNANIDHVVPQIAPYMETHPTPKWQPGPPPPPPETLNEHLWETSLKAQTISLNPNAALQQAIYKRGYVPVGSEVWTNYADKGYAVQPAEELTGKPRLAAVAEVGNWNNVWFVSNPDTDNLPVDPLSQRDSRWANKTLGQPTGHGKTIGNYGCLLVAYNMQARFLKLTGFLPDKFNQLMVEAGGFKDQYLKAGALQMAYPSQITYQDYKRRGDTGFLEMIRQYLDDGLPVPCRVDFRPSTEAWEEHWVLLIGYTPDDFYMADPWTGKIGLVSEMYDIAGDDLLEALFYRLKVAPVKIDLMPYVIGDGRRYYLANHDKSTQEILQSQVDGGKYYQCKNNAWESFVIDSSWIRRDKDTSPGGGRYYTQRESSLPARWLPRSMEVGQKFSVSLRVQFYTLADCKESAANSGDVTDSRQLVAHYSQWTSRHGVTLNDVVEVMWINGGERYFYARGFGLVGWERTHQDPNTPQWTAISELVQGGNNARMSGCFGT